MKKKCGNYANVEMWERNINIYEKDVNEMWENVKKCVTCEDIMKNVDKMQYIYIYIKHIYIYILYYRHIYYIYHHRHHR